MLNKFAFIFVIILVITSCGTGQKKDDPREKVLNFNISFVQDNEKIESGQGEIFLKKKPFAVEFELSRKGGIFVSASKNSETYLAAQDGVHLDKLKGFSSESISEEFFNVKEIAYLSDSSPNYWHYNSEEDNRFNSVKQDDQGYICLRKISNFAFSDEEGKEIKIEDYKSSELFLVFIQFEWSDDYTKRIEKKRLLYKIVFSSSSALINDDKEIILYKQPK